MKWWAYLRRVSLAAVMTAKIGESGLATVATSPLLALVRVVAVDVLFLKLFFAWFGFDHRHCGQTARAHRLVPLQLLELALRSKDGANCRRCRARR